MRTYSRALESSQIVTGPSLTSATCIIAPNTPVATGRAATTASSATNASNDGRAASGGAAPDHDGRLPFFVEANSVNCETLVYVGLRLIPASADFAAAVSPAVAVLLFVLFLPMAALAARVLLQTSGYAKSYKEAQLYFLPVFLLSLLPALVPFAAAQLVVAAPAFLLGEVVLSFLDVGLNDSAPSWGAMLRNLLNLRVLTEFSWNTAPLAFVFVTLLSLNLLGRGRAQERRGSRDRREPPGVV